MTLTRSKSDLSPTIIEVITCPRGLLRHITYYFYGAILYVRRASMTMEDIMTENDTRKGALKKNNAKSRCNKKRHNLIFEI